MQVWTCPKCQFVNDKQDIQCVECWHLPEIMHYRDPDKSPGILYHMDGFSLFNRGVAMFKVQGTYDKYGNRIRVFYDYKHLRKVLEARNDQTTTH